MHSFSTEGIVLKRNNVGEADRLLTIFTQDRGKMACIAKGVRKMTSSKRSALEPGTHSKLFCVETHGMPILTQAQTVNDYPRTRATLVATRSLSQLLEIVDRVTVEGEGQEEIFVMVVEALDELNKETPNRAKVLRCLENILENLGFQNMADTKFSNISQYVEFLSDKKMHSFTYLTVKK